MQREQMFRRAFDPAGQFVVLKPIKLSGELVPAYSIFDKSRVSTRRLRQLFNQRVLSYPTETGRDRAKPPYPTRPVLRERIGPAAMGVASPPVAATAAPVPPPLYPIPDGWQRLGWNGVLSLASKFSKVRVVNKRQAFAVVTAELERRARAA